MVTYFMDIPYLSYFNLKEEPYSSVASPRFLFLSTPHATALEKVGYVVGARKGICAVFGDTGTGKSSLARLLHQKFLDTEFISALITNPSYPTPNSFLRTVVQEFGIQKTDRSYKGMLDIFKEFLSIQGQQQGKTVVLILDEAQALTPQLIEVLRQLVNYETNDRKLLQIVLFAQEELRVTLARPKLHNFRSRIVFPSTLEPLDADELANMLDFRWRVASAGGELPFDAGAVQAIFERSNGMPREAVTLADNALLVAFYLKRQTIDAQLIEDVAHERYSNLLSPKENQALKGAKR